MVRMVLLVEIKEISDLILVLLFIFKRCLLFSTVVFGFVAKYIALPRSDSTVVIKGCLDMPLI